jgi:hypothetical protein
MVIKSKLKIFPHELLNLQRNIESVNYDLVSNQRQMLVIIHAFVRSHLDLVTVNIVTIVL